MKFILDLHTHTVASGHAYSTLEENIDGAIRNNIQILGMSDHAPKMPGTCHLFHFLNLKILPDTIKGVRVLKGVEVNILDYDGHLDMIDEDLEKMDYVIASYHPPCIQPSTTEDHTRGLLRVMENPHVNIIGHPDDSRYQLNMEQIVIQAGINKVLLEVNNSSLSEKSIRENADTNIKNLLELCKKHKTAIILSSDAHISYDVGNFSNIQSLLEAVDFPMDLIVNTSFDKLKEYIPL